MKAKYDLLVVFDDLTLSILPTLKSLNISGLEKVYVEMSGDVTSSKKQGRAS
jgi:hypothetical protein